MAERIRHEVLCGRIISKERSIGGGGALLAERLYSTGKRCV